MFKSFRASFLLLCLGVLVLAVLFSTLNTVTSCIKIYLFIHVPQISCTFTPHKTSWEVDSVFCVSSPCLLLARAKLLNMQIQPDIPGPHLSFYILQIQNAPFNFGWKFLYNQNLYLGFTIKHCQIPTITHKRGSHIFFWITGSSRSN